MPRRWRRYALIMETGQTENDQPAAGFGADGKPDFWIGGEAPPSYLIPTAITSRPFAIGRREQIPELVLTLNG